MNTINKTNSWAIKLSNVSFGYGNTIVLNDISTTIPSGEITFILGESGSGKSTLIKHIIGLAKPQSGKVFYGEEDFFLLSPKQFREMRRRFGVLFQDGALLGALTLAENVGLPLSETSNLPQKKIREIVLQVLQRVGLEAFADFYPNELSGGMKKRGGLARALVTDPLVMFCDEPTSGLDPINSAQMDQLLLEMKVRCPEMTIVVVSHDITSVKSIADRVILIKKGKLAFDGPYADFNASKDAYIHKFMHRV